MPRGLTLGRQTNYVTVTSTRRTKITAQTRDYAMEFYVPPASVLKIARYQDDGFEAPYVWAIQVKGHGRNKIIALVPAEIPLIRITSSADLHLVNDYF